MLNDSLLHARRGSGSNTATDETLYVLSRQYGRTILLLDRFGVNPLADALKLLTSPPALCRPLDDPLFQHDPDSAPILVELLHGELSHQVLLGQSISVAQDEALHLERHHSVCGWLFTDVSLERLQLALRQRLDVEYPDGERIYFRYFDPRVIAHLVCLLALKSISPLSDDKGFEQLLGPIRTWCHLDWEGRLLRKR